MKYWTEAPFWYLLLFGLLIPIGLPLWLNQFALSYWQLIALNALPLLLYLLLAVSYRPLKHNRLLAWLDDPFKQQTDAKKAGMGIAIALTLGIGAQSISVIALMLFC
ncbi:hypothetical protein HR45_08625 [Shewanella mangrovi]|uniref:Uncharacterized protein n=1 Tax=Shewanella mangrovi TaxID=1515746 RepID=A0A094JZT9_9GAMM|nr:hypothetical protein [Shewanella mangrovi]KFZ37896.1 hypothetical protein HR45_08625 [Shewanella mangrovi]